jgi:SSS family solute:Na+ symporter
MALAILFMGGQLSCMVTDCVQGLFTYAIFTVILIALLFTFSPDQFRDVLLARPAGQSFINPFDTHNLTDFNILFVLLGIMASVYGRMSWQGAAGYNCAAISPHEQKMGGVLSTWRDGFGRMKVPLLVMGAYILMNHPDFAPQAQAVRDELVARINLANPVTTETIRRQMMVPVALRHILPIGLTGAFVSLMLMAMVSTDTTYVQSWGSILVQDVILPLRKRPFTPRVQIWILRLSILGVAVFAWFFGMYFNQVTFILHFFAMTGALWGGFAGSVILGGLYWKKGTTAAAWTAAVLGLLLGGFGFFCQTYWADLVYPWLCGHHPDFLAGFGNCLTWVGDHCPIAKWEIGPKKFPISGVEWNSVTILCCVFGYVLVSLLTCREDFNLERMLHRGKYARDLKPGEKAIPMKSRITLRTFLGFTHEYSRGDKSLAFSVLAWTLYNFLVFLVLVVWNVLIKPWPAHWWFNYFYYYGFGLALVVGLVTVVWFTWGGTRDLFRLFAHLRDLQRNVLDDGRVVGHVSADDVAMVEKVDHVVIAEAHRGDGRDRPSD